MARRRPQAANIDLGLGDDKYLDLIKQSGTKHNFANSLGKRIEKVSIVNEGDSTKVVPKRWIERHIWIEINDILRLHGFSWLSNGKDSCWLRPGFLNFVSGLFLGTFITRERMRELQGVW